MLKNLITNIFKKKEKCSTNGKTITVNKTVTIQKPTIPVVEVNKTYTVTIPEVTLPEINIEPIKRYPDYYKNLYVILDNGHGEDTPGKRSPDGRLREYKYCREIVVEISKRLDEMGISNCILVPEAKDVPLKERVVRANTIHVQQHALKKTVIMLSVHCNAAGNGEWKTARGWSAWTSVGATSSDEIATCLYKAAHEVLDCKKIKIREDNSDGDPDWESNFYILQKSSMPAVLTENFFQDNKEDVKYLLSDEGREDIINIHVEGIKKYADLKFKR